MIDEKRQNPETRNRQTKNERCDAMGRVLDWSVRPEMPEKVEVEEKDL